MSRALTVGELIQALLEMNQQSAEVRVVATVEVSDISEADYTGVTLHPTSVRSELNRVVIEGREV